MSGVRKCIVSPNQHFYKYCPQCGRDNPEESWRFLFCSENCRDLYRVFEDYSKGNIDAVTAEARLNELSVPNVQFLQKSLADNLKEIRLKAAETHKAVAEAALKKEIEVEVKKKTAEIKVSSNKPVSEEKVSDGNKPKRKPRKKKPVENCE